MQCLARSRFSASLSGRSTSTTGANGGLRYYSSSITRVPCTVTAGGGRTLVGLDSMDSPDGAASLVSLQSPQSVPGPFSLIILSGIWAIIRAHYTP